MILTHPKHLKYAGNWKIRKVNSRKCRSMLNLDNCAGNWNVSPKATRQLQYLGRIQQIVDILESIGDLVSHHDQLEAALDGLPNEYQALTSVIQYRDEACPMIIA